MATVPKEEIDGIECRHVVFCRPQSYDSNRDLHVVKEIIHKKDGTTVPNLRFLYDHEQPYWITKPAFRDHEDKKEVEDVAKLIELKSTQSQLMRNISRALGKPGFKGSYKQLARSPFLYGSDLPGTSVIKRKYQNAYPDVKTTPYSVAGFDTEKDMIYGTDEINMATISFGDKVYTAVQSMFVKGRPEVVKNLHLLFEKYLGDYKKKRNITWEVEIVDTDIEVIRRCMQKAHEWQPDFVTVWNINFDMELMVESLKKKNIDPKYIFSDPRVPDEFKHFSYVPGPETFVSASGKAKALKPSERWHTVYTPASFYFIDGMCSYRLIRLADGEEQSYGLDAILEKKLGIRKLKFKEADHMKGVDWHQFMQSEYPLEYVIYNVFDCISMEELDETILDLRVQLPMMAGCVDLSKFKSQPQRLASELHYFALEKGLVLGSSSDQMKTELDDLVVDPKGWITTLPAHLIADNGLCIMKEFPGVRSNARGAVADLDVSAAYPSGGECFNISKGTTWRELCSIDGVDDLTRRRAGLNLSGGAVNSVEVCIDLFKVPDMDEWLGAFVEEMGLTGIEVTPVEHRFRLANLSASDVSEGDEEDDETLAA